MKDQLEIVIKAKKTAEYIIEMTENYPHKYIELKSRIVNTSFDIIEFIYIANIDYNQKKYIVPKLKMLDYYLKISYKNDIISKKKYEVISNFLSEIVKMVVSWSNEKKE